MRISYVEDSLYRTEPEAFPEILAHIKAMEKDRDEATLLFLELLVRHIKECQPKKGDETSSSTQERQKRVRSIMAFSRDLQKLEESSELTFFGVPTTPPARDILLGIYDESKSYKELIEKISPRQEELLSSPESWDNCTGWLSIEGVQFSLLSSSKESVVVTKEINVEDILCSVYGGDLKEGDVVGWVRTYNECLKGVETEARKEIEQGLSE